MLVHNFRSGSVMEKLGLDYETLGEHYPRLTYAVGSGYGSSGPYVEEIRGIRINGVGTELRLCAFSGRARTPDLPFKALILRAVCC